MFRCEHQTVFLAVLFQLVTSDIYKSVIWTTNNPLFLNSTGLSPCFGEDLEMRVHLMSSLPIVCPFEFIIMQTLPNRPATGVLYENFWIVYDEESFKNCDINMTYRGPDNEKNEKLHNCDTPDTLKSFAYSIDFKIKSPVNTGTAFVGGRYYYFLATSDGTDGSLGNTRGGHCNDPRIRMKFKVYVCKDDDIKCQNVPIGEFLCPNDIPATTVSPSTTSEVISTTSSESLSNVSTPPTSTNTESTPTSIAKDSTSTTGATTAVTTPGTTAGTTFSETKETNGPMKEKLQSKDIDEELSKWKTVAGIFICLSVFLIGILYFAQRHKKNSICFNDLNKVTPPGESPASDDVRYLTPNQNLSYNNLSYSKDYEDGKNTHNPSTFKPEMEKQLPVIDNNVSVNTPEKTYSPKDPDKPNSEVDGKVIVVSHDPSTFNPQINKQPTAPADNVIVIPPEQSYSPKGPNEPNSQVNGKQVSEGKKRYELTPLRTLPPIGTETEKQFII